MRDNQLILFEALQREKARLERQQDDGEDDELDELLDRFQALVGDLRGIRPVTAVLPKT